MRIVNRFILYGFLTVVCINLMIGMAPLFYAGGNIWAKVLLGVLIIFTLHFSNKMISYLYKMIDY